MSNPRRIWVHCSRHDRGQEWTARRIVPLRGPGEPTTPRLCVCRSVAACLAAAYLGPQVYVYGTDPVRTNPPVDVHDAPLTGERWVVPPVKLTLLTVLRSPALWRYDQMMRDAAQKGFFDWEERATILLAVGDRLSRMPSIGVPWITRRDRRVAHLVREVVGRRAPA